MPESKYGKFLSILLIIVSIGVIILIGFLGYDVISKYITKKEASEVLDKYENALNEIVESNNIEAPIENDIEIPTVQVNEISNANSNTTSSSQVTYKGYNVVGRIEIPTIDLDYPILERATPDSIELSVAVLYGPGPNQIGNTTIVGHNYRNGSFFGSNDKLKLGDKIYITDNSGTRIKYNIYNIYETSSEDSDFIIRDTNGKREVSLSTCTDNSKARLIIWAVEE